MYANLGMGIRLIQQNQKWDRTEVKQQKDSTGFCDKKIAYLNQLAGF